MTSLEEVAQNGRATRGRCGRVSEIFGAAPVGLCAFEELAQNGSRPRRRNREFLCCLAARDSALCAFRILLHSGLLAALLAHTLVIGDAQVASKPPAPLSVEEVVQLNKAGFSEDVIITKIRKNGR